MLEKNLQALATQNPTLANKILNHQAQDIEFDVAKSGDYNLIYKGIPLHDTQDPQLEAKLIFGKQDEEENKLTLVFGLGLGYLFKRVYISSVGSIIVYEPSLDILRSTLEVVEFSEEIADKRVSIVNELSGLEAVFLKYLYDKVSIMYLNSYKNMYSGLYEKVYFELNRLNLEQKTNTLRSIDIATAFMNSLNYFKMAPAANVLENKFKNKTVLVVSAGPSLDNTISLIKENRDKFVIISIGQAFKALYLAGILPDLVMVLDTYFASEWFNCVESPENELNLILATSAKTTLWELPAKTKFVYYSGQDYMTNWVLNRLEGKSLEHGATVSITATYLAKSMGANQIILIGQDLAYRDNKMYAANAIYGFVNISVDDQGNVNHYIKPENKLKESIDNKSSEEFTDCLLSHNFAQHKNTIIVKGWNSENLHTSSAYASFITEFNQMALDFKENYPDIKVINCSEGGAYLEGFEHLPLSEIIKDLPTLDITPVSIIYNEYISNKPDPIKVNNIEESLKNLIKDLKNLKEDALKVVKLANRISVELKNSSYVVTMNLVNMINKLQKLDKEVRKYNIEDRISFVYPFIQKELFEYNKLKDKMPKTSQEKLIYGINSIQKFSEVMIIAANRMTETYNNLVSYEKNLTVKHSKE